MSRILKTKNKMNMKNLIKYGFIAFVICLCSCDSSEEMKKSITTNRQNGAKNWSVVEYDGCEYIIGVKKGMHKGNCKNPIHNYR